MSDTGTTRRNTPPSALTILDHVIVFVMILANMVHVTGILLPFNERSVPIAILVQYIVAVLYMGLGLARGRLVPLLLGAGWIFYLIVQCILWSQLTGLPVNFNAALSYGTILIVFAFRETSASPRFILMSILAIASVYLLVYVTSWQQLLMLAGPKSSIFLPSDGVRGDRMYLGGPFAVFVLLYGLSNLRRRPVMAAVMLGLSGYALFIAQSRAAMLALALTLLVSTIGIVAREFRIAANIGLATIFLFLAGATISGLLIPDWNPYQTASSDSSGAARAVEFAEGRRALQGRVLTGFGIAGSNVDLQTYVRPTRPFFTSDIGLAGLTMELGLVVVIGFMILCVRLMTVPPVPLDDMNTLYRALFYTTQWSAFTALIGPTILGGAATMFAAVTFALWSHRRAMGEAAA